MRIKHRTSVPALALLIATLSVPCWAWADDWQPIRPDELQMTNEPQAPSAAAICLYRQVDRDDTTGDERVYVRYKILTDEGRKYANVEIPFDKRTESIQSIEARTVRPDGGIVPFDGKIYETPIAVSREADRLAKTFTLPDAGVGSIVEYRYKRESRYFALYDSHWILSLDLYTKMARFSLIPFGRYTLRYSWPSGLPSGTDPPRVEHGRVVLQSHDIPAFISEEYMPPENALRYRVDFIYLAPEYEQKDPTAFWTHYGKLVYRRIDQFVDKKGAMERAVGTIVSPDELTPPVDADYGFASYHSKSELVGQTLRYTRTIEIKELSVPVSKAEDLKAFYRVIYADERNVAVLKRVSP
jgi:hypothetical protein